VPRSAEVGWYASGAWSSVWRGRIVAATYEFLKTLAESGGSRDSVSN
jgi:hypothetical protein